MILSDTSIKAAMARGDIVVDPFDETCLGPNSYDVHLGKTLATYVKRNSVLGGIKIARPMDVKEEPESHYFEIGERGVVLDPGILYLAATEEYTETRGFVPYLDGKSSVGRLGISIHVTAGRGDSGFCNFWTLEVTVVHSIRVYAGMPIAQLTYHAIDGEIENPYDKRASSKYNGRDPRPKPSMMWRNFK